MRVSLIILLVFGLPQCAVAQNSLRNFGNLKVFQGAELGFQTNLVNDGSFEENLGRIGFYGSDALTISGAFNPQFHNLELFLDTYLFLETSIEISGNAFFFNGDIQSDKSNSSIYTQFTETSNYEGASNFSKIDGYALINNRDQFRFPVGDPNSLKTITIRFEESPNLVRSTYFFENPEMNNLINSNSLEGILLEVSSNEFWQLETEGRISISLNWNRQSELTTFLEELSRVTIVGWNKNENRWDNLGNIAFDGNLTEGQVSSLPFDAENYEIYTLASLFDISEDTPANYFVSVNGDGINDRLVIDGLERSPNNLLQIFNRNGRKVFEKKNYSSEFEGISTTKSAFINREQRLPTGVYFYIVKMYDLGTDDQGFLYLSR